MKKGKNACVSEIRDLLFRRGFGIVWVSQAVGNKASFVRELKRRLIDCYAQGWHTKDRFEKNKYRGFK